MSASQTNPPFPSLRELFIQFWPQLTARYDAVKSVGGKSTIIESGMFQSSRNPSPTYTPPQWFAYIHPEGKAYFCPKFGLQVVTEA
ncbi:hypothetical protein BYT27DRAFT_7249791 [Phlegmacium glaucopus]|nr:hypothetical protein BYT27DRAFT_7249791 [Phlegmacium glaucopus]